MSSRLVVGFALVVTCAVAYVAVVQLTSAPPPPIGDVEQVAAVTPAETTPPPPPPVVEPAPTPELIPEAPVPTPEVVVAVEAPPLESEPTPKPTPKPAKSGSSPSVPAKSKKSGWSSPGDETEPLIPISIAREALVFVGANPLAEDIWLTAINDPKMSAKARSNLIEDLNEDGFTNKKRPTVDDLPLIVSRINFIERHGPDSVDLVNMEAFLEAYKDLLNMYDRLTQVP